MNRGKCHRCRQKTEFLAYVHYKVRKLSIANIFLQVGGWAFRALEKICHHNKKYQSKWVIKFRLRKNKWTIQPASIAVVFEKVLDCLWGKCIHSVSHICSNWILKVCYAWGKKDLTCVQAVFSFASCLGGRCFLGDKLWPMHGFWWW